MMAIIILVVLAINDFSTVTATGGSGGSGFYRTTGNNEEIYRITSI